MALVWLSLCVASVSASLYDPHVPGAGTWYEGWYSRIVSENDSIAFVFGSYPHRSVPRPTFVGLLHAEPGRPNATPSVWQAEGQRLTVTKAGGPVASDPDFASPPHFEASFASDAVRGNVTTEGDSTAIQVALADATGSLVVLDARVTGPSWPWGPRGRSPEGWAGRLPMLHLHWFVYSLGSPVEYRLQLPSGEVRSGKGMVHQEKNWGDTWPKSWIWAEALSPSGGVALALGGGPAPVGPVTVPNTWLIGWQSPLVNLSYHPQDMPRVTVTHDACAGVFTLSAEGLLHRLEARLAAPFSSFAMLLCPTPTGFAPDSVQSHTTIADVSVYERMPIGEKLLETHTIANAALEFGGDYRCEIKA